ncbi:MAG: hypothetical protein Q9195_005323 [Heterodermia aff. obscurata]
MPLEAYEEQTLRKWMNNQSKSPISRYSTCQGSWRPDFLLEADENYRICEINARFAFNGFLHTAYGQQAFMNLDTEANPLTRPVVRPQEIYDNLLLLFNPSLPLHLLKGEEAGLDIHLFIPFVQSVTGRKPSLIKPSDLRLIDNPLSSTGFELHCVAGVDSEGHEFLERIHQIGLELHQHELRALSPAMLREISTCCFNDLRTIFLVHDKRMLGIILQELRNLVEVQKVLTPAQAATLRRGIAPTIIAGSSEMAALTTLSKNAPTIKDRFLLKPIRSGKGAGIIFGSDMTPASWIFQLEMLQKADLFSAKNHYVVQQKIEQPRYDVVVSKADDLQQNHLVGTYMSIHGRYGGLGLWRTSSNPICALSSGGSILWSMVLAKAKESSQTLARL